MNQRTARWRNDKGEVAAWLILLAGLAAAAILAAQMMGWTIGSLVGEVATAAEVDVGVTTPERPPGFAGDLTGDGPSGTEDDPLDLASLGVGGSTEAEPFDPVPASQYSPDRAGYHNYTTGANLICPAELQCGRQEMIDQLSRFAFPGQNPAAPVNDQDINGVTDPRPSLVRGIKPGGDVITHISPDGMTIVNRTLEGHVFHDGTITRQLSQVDGNWYIATTGVGNNDWWGVVPPFVMAATNAREGTAMFNYIDELMRANIEAHH